MAIPSDLDRRVADWIDRCGEVTQAGALIDYVDEGFPGLDEYLPIDPFCRAAETVEACADVLESHLSQTSSLLIRYASLHPFQRAAASVTEGDEPYREAFGRLVSEFDPEGPTTLQELRFELYNMYLVSGWEAADLLLSRIAKLDLLHDPAALHLLRGQFWFLSVFGRRIRFEFEDNGGQWDFSWNETLPSCAKGPFIYYCKDLTRQALGFAHPALLEMGSAAHWVLTAWCTNPRHRTEQERDDEPLEDVLQYEDDPVPIEAECEGIQAYFPFKTFLPPALTESQNSRLTRAAEDLRTGIQLDERLGAAYRPLLARALFTLGRFDDSARQFEICAERSQEFRHEHKLGEPEDTSRNPFLYPRRSPPEDGRQFSADYQWEATFFSAYCYRLAGKHDQSIQTLRPLANGGSADAAWWMARWLSEAGHYEEAAQLLRRALDFAWALPLSWELSSMLAVADVARRHGSLAAAIRQHIASNPQFAQVVGGAIREYWPTYSSLSPECCCHWLAAVELVNRPLLVAEDHIRLGEAIREFALVVEHELRTRVFEAFREKLVTNQEPSVEMKDRRFYGFLANKRVMGLGDMATAVEQSNRPRDPIEQKFSDFLKQNTPMLQAVATQIKEVADLRNPLSHSGKAITDANRCRDFAAKCRDVLDLICTPAKT